MLRELTIENFALIEHLRLEFGPGFTVLTGETGAGKSIIIDALNAVLGQRIGADSIRGGEIRARIEAVFDAADSPAALHALKESGLRDGDDTLIIVTREIASGRSHYRINQRSSTLSVLQDIGRHLVDIHGQHEHQQLIHEENHLSFLDAFGGPKHIQATAAYADEFGEYQRVLKALQNTRIDERERAQRLDMLRFQVQEIEEAGLTPDEEEALGAERLRLQHAEKIRDALVTACELLDADVDERPAALAAVQTAEQELAPLAGIDPDLASVAEELGSAGAVIEEAVRSLRAHLDDLAADPARLEEIEARLAQIASLKRKYGDSVGDILGFLDRAHAEVLELEDFETLEGELRGELERRRSAAGVLAEKVSAARVKLAAKLKQAVESDLAGLGMDAPTLQVAMEREETDEGINGSDGQRYRATSRGIDITRFLFSANAGESVRPLSKVASGGELSRLMLVFKSACSRGAAIPTIVFDEVDAGIGGRVAHAVGERIVGVAADGQVLCVTHLPQIARLADAHIRVGKAVQDGRTVVDACPLGEQERVDEVARMLGGAGSDATVRRHAEKLLQDGQADRDRLQARTRA